MKTIQFSFDFNNNKNGRVYPKEVIQKAIDNYMGNTAEYNKVGEYLIDTNNIEPYIRISGISHRIDNVTYSGDDVKIDATILDTPYGSILQNTFDANDKLNGFTIFPRMVVQADENNVVTDINTIISWDIIEDI